MVLPARQAHASPPSHASEISSPAPPRPIAAPPRIEALDVVRGVAVAGILFVNIDPMLETPVGPEGVYSNPVTSFLDLAVQQRFFPIFALLFGIGFGLLWDSAQRRSARPRIVMLRRLLVLLVLGLGHSLLQPGEALLPYAVCGLLLLLPATFLPDHQGVNLVLLVLGLAGLAVVAAKGGGMALVPVLLLTGWALTRSGAVARFTATPRPAVIGAVGLSVLAVPAVWWQAQELEHSGFSASSSIAGLVLAGAYVCLVCALLPTRGGRWLAALFSPLGRTALTTYVSATLVVVAVREIPVVGGRTVEQVLGLDAGTTSAWLLLMGVCVAINVVQSLVATAWLRHHRQGPLETAWRAVTWWQVPGRGVRV